MASSDRVTRLTNIRDNLEKELEDETAYRMANGPKPSYSVGGKSVSWNEYLQTMTQLIADMNAQVLAAGGDGGPFEEFVSLYSG